MMPLAPLWSVLFFVMLFTLGVDSQFGMLETGVTALVDEFAVLRRGRRKVVVVGVVCVVLFILGLPQCSPVSHILKLEEASTHKSARPTPALFGVIWPIEKHRESLLRCRQQKTVTASVCVLQPTALLLTGRCHINFSFEKSAPMRCGLSSKLFDRLLLLGVDLGQLIRLIHVSPG